MFNKVLERSYNLNKVFNFKNLDINPNDQSVLLVQNLAFGVCGTDIDIAKSCRSDKAKILGHEGIGRIYDIYQKNDQFKIGDLVVYNPVSMVNVKSVLGHSYNGIFSLFRMITKTELKNSIILSIPNETKKWAAAFLEPLATVIYGNEIITKVCLPKKALIIGTGAISHIIAYYMIRKGCHIDMVSRSEERIKALKARHESINYCNIDYVLTKKYDAIFCCAARAFAFESYKMAEKIATEDTIIVLVNGFNQNIIMNLSKNSNTQSINLNTIREINSCGKNHKIFNLTNKKGKKLLITGHRCNSLEHMEKASKEIIEASAYYSQLIDKNINFEDLPEFFNSKCLLSLSHRGKILVNIDWSLYEI